MTRRWLLTAFLCALALNVGCSHDARTHGGATLRVAGSGADLGQPDPHVSTKSQDKFLFGLLYNGLVRFRPGRADAASIEPDLAERWSVSADQLVWTFHLRHDVRFHALDRPLTAADVVYSLRRVANPKLSPVAADYAVIADVSALDDYTVRITLAHPAPYLLGLVSNYQGGMIVAAPSATSVAKDAIGSPYGTGPYYVEDYQPRRYLLLRGNPEYFRGRPQIDSIIYRFVDSDVSRELASLNGELDLFLGVREGRWVQRVRQRAGMTVDVFGPPELRSLHMDLSKPPLGDIRVRLAIAHAIDREALVAFVGAEVARAARSPLPRGYGGYSDDVPDYSFDPALARKLLADAGYPSGFVLPVVISRQRAFLNPMLAIKAQLQRVGIQLDLQSVEHNVFHQRIRRGESALIYYGAARFPTADLYLPAFYHSAVPGQRAPLNFSGCSAADEFIDAALVESDPNKRNALWARAQRAIVEAVCAVPLFELKQTWARRNVLDYGYVLEGAINVSPIITERSRLAL